MTTLASKVKSGDELVIHFTQYMGGGQNEKVLGIFTVNKVGRNNVLYGVTHAGRSAQYDENGWGRGKSRYRVRPLKDGETAESVLETMRDASRKRREAQQEQARKREEERKARNNQLYAKYDAWLAADPGRVTVRELMTVAGSIDIVEICSFKPVVLMFTYVEEHRFDPEGSVTYTVNVGISTGGSTKMYNVPARMTSGEALAREYVKTWGSWDEDGNLHLT